MLTIGQAVSRHMGSVGNRIGLGGWHFASYHVWSDPLLLLLIVNLRQGIISVVGRPSFANLQPQKVSTFEKHNFWLVPTLQHQSSDVPTFLKQIDIKQ
jgi:hypothetical protein